jgi:DNA polymerase-3 subunit beta
VKFRSERDALIDMLATAGRAVGARATSSPVLSGLLLSCTGNVLSVTGTDLDLTIQVTEEVIGVEDGACVGQGSVYGTPDWPGKAISPLTGRPTRYYADPRLPTSQGHHHRCYPLLRVARSRPLSKRVLIAMLRADPASIG